MSTPNRLAVTGSVFSLPLLVFGAVLTFAGWVMNKLGRRPAAVPVTSRPGETAREPSGASQGAAV